MQFESGYYRLMVDDDDLGKKGQIFLAEPDSSDKDGPRASLKSLHNSWSIGLDDFYEKFEPAPDGVEIRKQQIGQLMDEVEILGQQQTEVLSQSGQAFDLLGPGPNNGQALSNQDRAELQLKQVKQVKSRAFVLASQLNRKSSELKAMMKERTEVLAGP